jgi:mRNA interferase MazF
MQKDFDSWNIKKKETHYQDDHTIYFREGDIWWCRLGVNIGFEQDGKGESFSRPILILKKFNQLVFWALPLSTRLKQNKYYMRLKCSDGEVRAAIISQLRLVSVKRLTNKICSAEDASISEIKKAIKDML